jgi:hypothetical protein
MLMPSIVLKESNIDKAVREAAKEVTPDVHWIRYEIALDWSGDPAILLPSYFVERCQPRGETRKGNQAG